MKLQFFTVIVLVWRCIGEKCCVVTTQTNYISYSLQEEATMFAKMQWPLFWFYFKDRLLTKRNAVVIKIVGSIANY